MHELEGLAANASMMDQPHDQLAELLEQNIAETGQLPGAAADEQRGGPAKGHCTAFS